MHFYMQNAALPEKKILSVNLRFVNKLHGGSATPDDNNGKAPQNLDFVGLNILKVPSECGKPYFF